MIHFTHKFIAACALIISATASFAHDGRGMADVHWHATDTSGFVAVSVLVAMAVWLSSK